MKIVHFLNSLNPIYGGPTTSVPVQCLGIRKLGVEIGLVTYSESAPWEEKLVKSGVEVLEINKSLSRFEQLFSLSLLKFLNHSDLKASILHNHGVWLPAEHWVATYAKKNGIKYVINPRGDLETYRINYNKWKKLKKQVIWWLYAKKNTQDAACILATSNQEADAVRRLGITAPIAIIPNGIEMDVFPKVITHTTREKKVVLFLSRVNPIKGLELLIEAWSKLPNNLRTNWELHIVGNSDPEDYVHKLEEQIIRLELQENVKLLDPITGDAKMQKYMNSDLFILPTFNENFGNVIAEAMMCECPVITTTNAPWEVLVEDHCGWWIELSVNNLVATLVEAMSLTDEERVILGKKSRQCIINHFSSETVARKTKMVYDWILGKEEKPDFVQTV